MRRGSGSRRSSSRRSSSRRSTSRRSSYNRGYRRSNRYNSESSVDGLIFVLIAVGVIILLIIIAAIFSGIASAVDYANDPVDQSVYLEPNRMTYIDINERFDEYKLNPVSGALQIYGYENEPTKIDEITSSETYTIVTQYPNYEYFLIRLSKGAELTIGWTVLNDYGFLNMYIIKGQENYNSWVEYESRTHFDYLTSEAVTYIITILDGDDYYIVFDSIFLLTSRVEITWKDFIYETDDRKILPPNDIMTDIGALNYFLIQNTGTVDGEVIISLDPNPKSRFIEYSLATIAIILIFFVIRNRKKDKQKRIESSENQINETDDESQSQNLVETDYEQTTPRLAEIDSIDSTFNNCLNCYEINPSDSEYCMECGTKL